MEPEIIDAPVSSETSVPNEAAAAPVVASEKTPFVLSKNARNSLVALGIIVGVFAIMTSFVYRQDPTDSSVRKIIGVIPYPAAVIGNHVVTLKEYLGERDALQTYFRSSAAQSGSAVPEESAIERNIMDTISHKIVVDEMAGAANVAVDDAKVDELYASAMGGADPAVFAEQVNTMFGWTVDEFRTRVLKPVVLAAQMEDSISADAGRQAARLAKIQAAYDRVAAGEDFATVATEASEHASSATGGDVGEVAASDIPDEWKGAIAALAVGEYSKPIEGTSEYMIFKVTARTGKDADEKVTLSLISVPKVTLEEVVQEYLATHRNWRLIGNS